MRAVLLALLLVAGRGQAATPPDRATAAIPPLPRRVGLPRVDGPAGAPLVVIDAGHGGHDPGSTARDGTREKAIALRIAQDVRAALLDDGGVRVALTRDGDHFLTLAERREIARALDAGLLLSIHCDSTADPAIHGASIYTLALRSTDPAARALASRENRADMVNGHAIPAENSTLSTILTGLARRETQAGAALFADLLGRALGPLGILKADYRRAAELKVLRAPDMPSVLLETGYISSPADLRRLRSPHDRHLLARAIAGAARAFVTRADPARVR